MYPSKLHHKIPLAVIFVLLASSCTKPTTGVDTSSGATFFVQSLNGGGSQQMQRGTKWKIPESVKFTFQACLKARGTRTDLYNQDFGIENPVTGDVTSVKTNKTGCLNWQESIPYNHLAGQSGWIELQRDIVGRGINLGKQSVRIAVNPWAVGEAARDKGEAVVYLESGDSISIPTKIFPFTQATKALSGELQGAARLIVQNVDIKSSPQTESDSSVTLLIDVEMQPVVQSRNAVGDTVYQKVQDGEFEVMLQVLAGQVGANMNQKVILLGGNLTSTGRVINGRLKAEFTVRQERLANQGNLELVMRIDPRALDPNKNLQNFEGLFRFGPGTVVGAQSGSLANICLDKGNECAYDKILAQAANYSDLVKQGYIGRNERYIFSTLQFHFLSIPPGETSTQRTAIYSTKVCITDRQTGEPLANTPVQFENIGSNEGHVQIESLSKQWATNHQGCLIWNSGQFHKYYTDERFFKKTIRISKLPGFSRSFEYYVNPWNDGFKFGYDAREVSSTFFEQIEKRPRIASRIFVNRYQLSTHSFQYKIDSQLNLHVVKALMLGLEPKVLRYSGIVNRRDTIERLRDGIYLMKVALQKNYLDPRENSGWLLKNSANFTANLQNTGGKDVDPRNFIFSNLALVRVADGTIVHILDFAMSNLRLMRVRSNLLIQLEPVDERMIQAYHVFRKRAIQANELEQKLVAFRSQLKENQSLADVRAELGSNESPTALVDIEAKRAQMAEVAGLEQARTDLEARVARTQEIVRLSLEKLRLSLESGAGAIGHGLSANNEPTGQVEYSRGTLINNNFQIGRNLLSDLETALNVNEISSLNLPTAKEIDLNIFVDRKAGLDKRTFVGPMIYLANAQSDLLRATDQLDGANCAPDGSAPDALSRSWELLDQSHRTTGLNLEVESELFGNRANNAYQFQNYYASLQHLCHRQVDHLIEEERMQRQRQLDQFKALPLKASFAKNFNMEYVSLTDEPLVGAELRTLSVAELNQAVHQGLSDSVRAVNSSLGAWIKRFRGDTVRAQKDVWTSAEFSQLFFERTTAGQAAMCNALANRIATGAQGSAAGSALRSQVLRVCGAPNGLIHDIKLRVKRLGDTRYLGGLNLNLGVSHGFSIGTSEQWGYGVDLLDAVGSILGFIPGAHLIGAILKPFSLGYGKSMSQSEGTSVDESTSLVSQIARFEIQLVDYERCAAIRLSDVAIQSLMGRTSPLRRSGRAQRPAQAPTENSNDLDNRKLFSRGLFVCEGLSPAEKPVQTVRESYFYLSQQVTESDMLDHTDLYNYPWLLAFRGMRDFSVFIDKIRAQGHVNLPELLSSNVGQKQPTSRAWTVEHLRSAYHDIMPAHPGFFTVLDRDEPDIDAFAKDQMGESLTQVESDPLGEINHPHILQDQNRAKLRPPAHRSRSASGDQ